MSGLMEKLSAAEVERISAENRAKWLDAVDGAETVASRLDMLATLLSASDMGLNPSVVNGMDSVITEGAETIRALCALVSSCNQAGSEDQDTE